tara:strand:- start:141 stop:344 length:204 start_codon:yes stop_codon:yes gene_type:complete
MTQLDKTTLAVVYLGLIFGVPAVCVVIAFRWTWHGVSAMAQKLGSFGLLLCRPFMVVRNGKQPSVRG